jgi:hypothetical protein
MRHRDDFQGWLPIGITFADSGLSVRWIECGQRRLTEPFFPQTIRRLRTLDPPARERVTSAGALLEHAKVLPSATPAVVIFHVSRCGSTLLTNALGVGQRVVVLSEARPVGALVNLGMFTPSSMPARVEEVRRRLLDAVIRTCAYHHYAYNAKVVVKVNASTILHMTELRDVWPNVRFVVLIRDPVEVMVSNLSRPAGWMRARHVPLGKRTLFGWTGAEVQQMQEHEYCARGLARFFEAARHQMDEGCTLVDYEDLTPEYIAELGEGIGIQMPAATSDEFLRVFRIDAKDVARAAVFEDDRARKARDATDAVRRAALEWTEAPYRALRSGEPRVLPRPRASGLAVH